MPRYRRKYKKKPRSKRTCRDCVHCYKCLEWSRLYPCRDFKLKSNKFGSINKKRNNVKGNTKAPRTLS